MNSFLLSISRSKWRKTPTEIVETSQSLPIWFKPNYSRKEADEFLRDKLIGVFVLRASETIQDCFVLSVKVPKYMNKLEVNHYLVVPATSPVFKQGGYKIKGSNKEFSDMNSLITHCSLIRGELPILLNSDFYLDEATKLERKRADFFYYSSSTSSLASTISSELSETTDDLSHKLDENNNVHVKLLP